MINETRQFDLFEICSALSEIPLLYRDRPRALKRIVELGRQAMGSRACTLTLVDGEDQCLIQAAIAGDEDFERRMTGKKIKLGSPAGGNVLDLNLVVRGEMVEKYNLQEAGQGVAHPDIARQYDLNAVLSCPLKADGRLIGYLNHFSSATTPFTPEDKRLIEILARRTVTIMQILDELEKATGRQRLARLNDVMQEMTAARNAPDLLELMLDRGLELVGGTRGWVSRLDFDTGELRIVAHRGEPSNVRPLLMGRGVTGLALQTEKPIRADDVRDGRWKGIYEEFWPDTRSELAVPLLISNAEVRVGRNVQLGPKPIGVFNVESPTRDAISQADENLLWSLARFAAVLIDRLELDRKLTHLAKIQQEIIGKRDWDDIIEIMLKAITDTLGYAYVNISLVKPELKRIKTEYITGIPGHEVEEFKRLADHPLDGDDIQADVVRSRQIEVPDPVDKRFDPAIYKRFRHQRLIRVYMPMIIPSDDRVIGTVEAGYERKYRKYIYEQDIQILKGFMDYAVRALEQRQRGLLDKISHELRSPVVGIRSNASFLQRRMAELSADLVERKFDDILTDCDILLFQIRELEHTLGRPSPAPAKIERTLVFRDVIIKTVRQLKPLVIERGFDTSQVEYDNADMLRIGSMYIDKAKLNQVVYNLLVNSIKYAQDDPDAFRIRISVDERRDVVVIKFQDWGIGIEDEYAEKIFEPGFRTPAAIGRHVTGTGLGLTIARQTMRELGGDLRLANTHNPTEFHIMLPKKLKEAPDDTAAR